MPSSVPASTGSQLHAELWRSAYERLDGDLKRRYEAILKAELNVQIDTDFDDQAMLLVQQRKQRVTNRQWTYSFRGRPRKVRDQVDKILDIVQKGSSIVSVGMNFAPVFVSLPWTAITTLLPFITNDTKEHNAALKCLEQITEVMARYNIVEAIHIDPSSMTFAKLKDAVVDLYSKIFEFQARLADYLGKNTLRRFGINSLQLGGWSDLTQAISSADTTCQGWIRLHDSENTQTGIRALADLMMEQRKCLEAIAYKLTQLDDQRAVTYKILSWISDHDAFEDHDDKRDRIGDAYLLSGQWLYRTDEYKSWDRSYSDVLILRGSVGTGKSSLISIILEHLLNTSARRVAFYYCSRSSTDASNYQAVVLSLLRQLACGQDGYTLNSIILDKYERRTQRSWKQLNVSRNDLLDLMVDIIDESPEATIVIDALDECADPNDLLKFLNELSGRTQKLRFLFSTRPHIVTRPKITHADHIDEIDVADHTAEDIDEFLETELSLRSRGEGDMPSLRQATTLYNTLRELASGMFRWVRLQVDLFLRIELPHDFDSAIQRLAETTLSLKGDDRAKLYAAYNEMYDSNVGHSPTDAHAAQADREAVVQRVLLWTLCAHRPLRVCEMLEAVKINDDDSTVSGIDEEYLLIKGSNFIRKDAQHRVVFTHLSVREYLIESGEKASKERFSFDEASRSYVTARTSMSVFRLRQPRLTDWEFLTTSTPSGYKWTFYSYCCTYWVRHWQASVSSDETELISKVLFSYVAPLSSDHYFEDLCRYAVKNTHFHKRASSLEREAVQALVSALRSTEPERISRILAFVQCLAACGLPLFSEQDRFRKVPNALAEGLLHETPETLMELAITRSDSMLEMLLHYGARVDVRTFRNHNLLHAAAAEGTVNGMRMLLKSPSAAGCLTIAQSDGLTPIEVALAQHNFGCADVLWSALLEADEAPIQDSIAKLYTSSLCRTRPEPGNRWESESDAHAFRNVSLGTLDEDQILCSKCLPLLSRRGYLETGHDFQLPDFDLGSQAFRAGVPLGSPTELVVRAAGGCQMCKLFQKLSSDTLSPRESARISAHLDVKFYAAALVSTFLAFYYALLAGFSLLFLWGYFVFSYKQKNALRIVVQPYCTKLSFRERYMNIWTVDIQKGASGSQVLSSREFEICQGRDLHRGSPIMIDDNGASSTRSLYSSPLNEHTFADDSLSLMRSWLSKCEGHGECQPHSEVQLPTLVLDVSTPGRLTLREGVGLSGRYCIFSGVWGGMVSRYALTTHSNFERYRTEGILMETLPAAWRDAAELARLLGFRYFWVDGLCIVQDDAQSWAEEFVKLPDYFKQAHLVLASALSDSSTSLRKPRPAETTLLKLKYSSPPKDSQNSSTEISIRAPLEDSGAALVRSHWARRGWTMGEQYLAGRMLIIGEEQIYWNCNTLLWSEGSTEPQQPLWRLSCSAFTTRSAASVGDRSTWYSLVEYHTSTALTTYPGDRLVSLGSLAAALANGDRYWAGIWQDDLHVGLLWRRLGQAPSTSVCDIPSWSWGCLGGAVSFRTSAFKRLESSADADIVEICVNVYRQNIVELNFQTALRNKDEPLQYGSIISGYLTLSALSRGADMSHSESPGMYVFDQDGNENGKPWSEIPLTTALISQWDNLSGTSCRWHGLLLHKADDSGEYERERYRRVGVYMGPLRRTKRSERIAGSPVQLPGLEDGWERREFHII